MVIFPGAILMPLTMRVIILVACLVIALSLVTGKYAIHWSVIVIKKVRAYDQVLAKYDATCTRLRQAEEMLGALWDLVAAGQRYPLSKVLIYKTELFIVLPRRKGTTLESGRKVVVVNMSENSVMGQFEITEILAKEYRARKVDYVDPVWEGFVRQANSSHCDPPPNSTVLVLPIKEQE
jgi:hypothetical protein